MHSTGETISDTESERSFRFLLANVGDAEDLERYEKGGFHPVHLGDLYDGNRYRVVHKLGYGGFSTIWLAHDAVLHTYVALKIALADESASIEAKTTRSHRLLSSFQDDRFVTYLRFFYLQGPNGRHLCLVLPVLGPSTYALSHFRESRMSPWLARDVALQATKALANLHSRGFVHGDLTPKNLVFRLKDIDFNSINDEEIYQLFGKPETGPLETEKGDTPGPEAPRYIVRTLDFFASGRDIFSNKVSLIDFDQSFTTPPEKLLGTPVEFLAPEVAVGRHASQASDVWALGCTIMRLRHGDSLFSAWDIQEPHSLVQAAISAFGELPSSWGTPYFDDRGKPTPWSPKAFELNEMSEKLSLRGWVNNIWDYPGPLDESSLPPPPSYKLYIEQPYPPSLAHKIWKPAAVRVKDIYLKGYNDDIDQVVATLPKIDAREADLLYDLLSKILQLDPSKRPTARELINHPWFSLTD